MKKWAIYHMTTERRLGFVLADWAEEASSAASARGFKHFYVELHSIAEPTRSDCITLAACSSAESVALMFRPKTKRVVRKFGPGPFPVHDLVAPAAKTARRLEVED